MKAGTICIGSGPIFMLATYDSPDAKALTIQLAQKSVNKFLAVEVPLDRCRKKHGRHYDLILTDVKQTDDLRVADDNGFNMLYNFPFSTHAQEIRHES